MHLSRRWADTAYPVAAPNSGLYPLTSTEAFPDFVSAIKHPMLTLVKSQNILPLHPVKYPIPLRGNPSMC